MDLLPVAVVCAILVALLGILAIIFVIFISPDSPTGAKYERKSPASLLAVLGSGGHTTELLRLVEQLGEQYQPRYFVVANTDSISEKKVKALQRQSSQDEILRIPRSREVKQSWVTTVLSTAYATLYSFPLVFKYKPDIILCNGPGTCIPICVAGFILKIFKACKIVYVESICRVETLSLSGKLLYHTADSLIVQWPQLHKKYPKSLYMGRLG